MVLRCLFIESRLLITLLLVGVCSCLAIGLIAYFSAETAIRNRVADQLTSIRSTRAEQIESFFQATRRQVLTATSDLTVTRALKNFRDAINEISDVQFGDECRAELEGYYQSQFMPKLNQNILGKSLLKNLLSSDPVTCELQHRYVLPELKKNNADEADVGMAPAEQPVDDAEQHNGVDLSPYERVHDYYHDHFVDLKTTFGYYDVFLIDPESMRIVYSVAKEVDFGTNLKDGPHSSSNLAKVVREVAESNSHQNVTFSDFTFYDPSYGAPAAFVAGPVYDGNERVGIYAIQFPIDQINRIMTGNQGWKKDGLGDSGAAYLVSADRKMRSDSRFLITEPDKFAADLQRFGVSKLTTDKIRRINTTILLQEVDTEGVQAAFRGDQDTRLIADYRGIQVLSSFQKLSLEDQNWVLLAEIDAAEAFAPLRRLRNTIAMCSAGLLTMITLLAMLVAAAFTRPINRVIGDARDVADGKKDEVRVRATDEFGTLATSLNEMVGTLKSETKTAQQEAQNLGKPLRSVLPEDVTKRIQSGETEIVDAHTNVAVIYVRVNGWNRSTDVGEADDGVVDLLADGDVHRDVLVLNEFVSIVDDMATEYGIEKVGAFGGNYIATCGIEVQRLDRLRRALDFAVALIEKVEWFKGQKGIELDVNVGLSVGAVVAGVIGSQNVIFDVWGVARDEAVELSEMAGPNEINVTAAAFEALQNAGQFDATDSSNVFRWVSSVNSVNAGEQA